MIVHRGRWTRDDRAAAPYRSVEFEVPPGTEAVTVTLAYDTAAGVLDLGCAGPAGYRGWSGGARSAYGIGRTAATPGYLPGSRRRERGRCCSAYTASARTASPGR